MNNQFRAYSKDQFWNSNFDTTGYVFNESEGEFSGTLVCKKWGQKHNVNAYVDLDDGRKILCTAFQTPDEYHGIPDMPFGARITLTFQRNRKGNMKLTDVQRIG